MTMIYGSWSKNGDNSEPMDSVHISNTTSISENVNIVELMEFAVGCTCDYVNVTKIIFRALDGNNIPIQDNFLFKISI